MYEARKQQSCLLLSCKQLQQQQLGPPRLVKPALALTSKRWALGHGAGARAAAYGIRIMMAVELFVAIARPSGCAVVLCESVRALVYAANVNHAYPPLLLSVLFLACPTVHVAYWYTVYTSGIVCGMFLLCYFSWWLFMSRCCTCRPPPLLHPVCGCGVVWVRGRRVSCILPTVFLFHVSLR